MLEHEKRLRLSGETQRRYEAVEAAGGDASWMEVTEELQRAVVRHFGVLGVGSSGEARGLAQLRGAAPRHPEVAFWVRHNRARRGSLARGSFVPDVSLATLKAPVGGVAGGSLLSLRAQVPSDGRPLAVVAISYS
mmetsp:Transcript_75984/g.148867  ORF Transcript_75984/g.148867 Transcript_75984/m.148867 type:complete len:135 (-) Transcript_75984:53-457(-)